VDISAVQAAWCIGSDLKYIRSGVIRSRLECGRRRCTTRRRKTHITDARELLYPWHPWASQRVFVHRVVSKTAEAVFHCSLDSTPARRLLQIPQWMFDSAVMCGVHLASVSVVDAASLQELKVLLSAMIDDDVVQGQHPSVDDAGENDAKVIEATAAGPTQALSSHRKIADLERTAVGSKATSTPTSRSTTARSDRSRTNRQRTRRAKR